MRRVIQNRISLSLFFSLVVLIIFMITALIVATISFFFFKTGLITPLDHDDRFLEGLILLFSCVVVGTAVSLFLGRIPLKPIRKVIACTNQLAMGDFSARLSVTFPPEFKELSESFNRMAEELSGIELLRTDFVNNFSHEFKTPIVSIKGFAEMLKKEDLSESEKNEYLDIIISESDRLALLATNVLNLSKIETQKILTDIHFFNLAEQVRRCILMLETKWESKDILLALDIDEADILGSEELLSQVWLNLLDNAIKYTPKGGNIDVSLKLENDMLCFIIRDNGCGIGDEEARRIFEKFYRADSTGSVSGNGLGLSIAQKIVELHRGAISCSSRESIGTEFKVLLPQK